MRGFYSIFLLTIVDLLALLGIATELSLEPYVVQVFAVLSLIMFVWLFISLIYTDIKVPSSIVVLFFSLNLLNVLYLSMYTESMLFIMYSAATILGFIVAVSATPIRKKTRIKQLRRPKIVIEDLKEEKKVIGTAKKAQKKETASKKTAKKKTAKKRPVRKSARKKAVKKKATAKKKTTAKKATRNKAAKKKAAKKKSSRNLSRR